MNTWRDPCVRDSTDGAHDFEPLVTTRAVVYNGEVVVAICRKCGIHR